MRWRVQISQPESRPSGTERYLRVVHPAVRGCRGIVAAVAGFSAADAIGGRGGPAPAHGLPGFLGSDFPLNFPHCPATPLAITAPSRTPPALSRPAARA